MQLRVAYDDLDNNRRGRLSSGRAVRLFGIISSPCRGSVDVGLCGTRCNRMLNVRVVRGKW